MICYHSLAPVDDDGAAFPVSGIIPAQHRKHQVMVGQKIRKIKSQCCASSILTGTQNNPACCSNKQDEQEGKVRGCSPGAKPTRCPSNLPTVKLFPLIHRAVAYVTESKTSARESAGLTATRGLLQQWQPLPYWRVDVRLSRAQGQKMWDCE